MNMINVIFLLSFFAFQRISSCSSTVQKRSLEHTDEYAKLRGSSFYKVLEGGGQHGIVNSGSGRVSFYSAPSRFHDPEGIAYEHTFRRHSYVYHPYPPHPYYHLNPYATHFFANNHNYHGVRHQNYLSHFDYAPSVYSSSISMNSHNGRSVVANSYNNNGRMGGSYFVSGYYPKK